MLKYIEFIACFYLSWHPLSYLIILQCAKKIVFTACHSGKLKLAFTSPDVISTSPKNVLTSRIDFTVLLSLEFLKRHHLPVNKSPKWLLINFKKLFFLCLSVTLKQKENLTWDRELLKKDASIHPLNQNIVFACNFRYTRLGSESKRSRIFIWQRCCNSGIRNRVC